MPDAGGCVCLKAGLHLIAQTLTIGRSRVYLVGEIPGTTVRVRAAATALLINQSQDLLISRIAFERELAGSGGAVIEIVEARRVSIEDCSARSLEPSPLAAGVLGINIHNADDAVVLRCLIGHMSAGIWIYGGSRLTLRDNVTLSLVACLRARRCSEF